MRYLPIFLDPDGQRRALTSLTEMGRGGPVRDLIAVGLDPATPVSIVENTSLDTEKVVTGRLDQLSDLVTSAGIQGPAILFIGVAPLPAAFSEARADIAPIPPERAA